MRLMAGVAGDSSGVIRDNNLRKALRLGAVGLVAAGTHHGCVQFLGLYRSGIIGVPGQSSVASLASNHHMLAKLLLVYDVGVAGLAGVASGKCNRSGRDLTDRRSSIVAILPKAVRYDGGAQNYECHQRDGDDGSQPNEVFDVLKQARVPWVLLPGTICAQNCAMLFDTRDSSGER